MQTGIIIHSKAQKKPKQKTKNKSKQTTNRNCMKDIYHIIYYQTKDIAPSLFDIHDKNE